MDRRIILGAVAAAIFLLGALYFYQPPQDSAREETQGEQAARQLVESFGGRLLQVSLLSPQAAQLMDEHYAAFVAPELLAEWKNDPVSALGRLTSSPWPDRIEVSSVRTTGEEEYEVAGEIIEITSLENAEGGAAARRPATFTVGRVDGSLLITGASLQTYGLSVPEGWNLLEQPSFSIAYPAEFFVETGEGIGGGRLDQSLAKIGFPRESYPGTNFIDAFLVISRSDDTGCVSFSGIPGTSQTTVVNGISFQERDVTEAAAGNIYEGKLLRTVHGGQCYEIALTAHTGSIGNYPEGSVTEFPSERALQDLERRILTTFRFVD